MRALIKAKPAPGAEVADVPIPKPGPDDVLVRVRATSVCGTDLHIYHWNEWAAGRMKTPIVFGHECTGEVVEVGSNVQNVSVGAHVSIETHIACGHCYQCRTDRIHLCKNVKLVGVDRPGAFAEYISIPARNVWINDAKLPWEIGTILEPFGNAVHSISAIGGVEGRRVLVSGAGPIGIMAVGAARALGALAIYVTDINPYRLELARKMEPTKVFNAKEVDVYEALMDETRGEGVDAVLEMAGAPSAIETSFRLLKGGGSVALLGLPDGAFPFNLTENVILKGAKVFGIFGREMFKTWYKVRALVESGSVDLSKVITHKYTLDQFGEGMKTLESGRCGKLVFTNG